MGRNSRERLESGGGGKEEHEDDGNEGEVSEEEEDEDDNGARGEASNAGPRPRVARDGVGGRAVRTLPGSYKLWHGYLSELLDAARPLPVSDPSYAALNGSFERALLTTMHKMPRIWLIHLASLTDQRRITLARRTFDCALRVLPVSQHARVWPLYLRLVSLPGVPLDTAVRVHRRYLAFDPSHLEDYVELLLRSSRWQEAATRLAAALNDKSFCSVKGKTRRQLWLELCDIIASHAPEISISGLNIGSVLCSGIRQFTDELGMLWNSLATTTPAEGSTQRRGLIAVSTARDFGIIFEAYAQFEQSLLAAKFDSSDG